MLLQHNVLTKKAFDFFALSLLISNITCNIIESHHTHILIATCTSTCITTNIIDIIHALQYLNNSHSTWRQSKYQRNYLTKINGKIINSKIN